MRMEQAVLSEVPQCMKRLIRLITRGFYTIEHALVIDMLVRNPCMKEDDMIELLKFDRKQLRVIVNTLKNEKFLKSKMRVETDPDGRTTRHNFYFINYLIFVNIVKYKLDHVRRKIEMEERDSTSRASFKCDGCQKTFTDLEADQLFDFMTQTFKCTICGEEVQEDESAIPKQDARTLIARFNEQIQPIYDLLRECEDVKLAPELLEPEPTDLKHASRNRGTSRPEGDRSVWSGDATRNRVFGDTESHVTVSMNGPEETTAREAAKAQPVWMQHSTVDGASLDVTATADEAEAGSSKRGQIKTDASNEIETLLLIHEKKSNMVAIPSLPEVDSESSDSDADTYKPQITADVEDVDSEGEEEVVMVTVNGNKVPLNEVTDEMVGKMSLDEKAEYIRLGQEMYNEMYE